MDDQLERLRANRWPVIGISLGILMTVLVLPGDEGLMRYIYLLLGGAIGWLAGTIVAKLLARKP